MKTYTIQGPSITSIAAGLHEDGETVTVSGILNGHSPHRTRQGNDWAEFRLIGEHAAIDIAVFPLYYQEFRDLIGPVRGPGRILQPPTVTATGRVETRGTTHSLVVTTVECHGHEGHAPHPNLRIPAAVRADMDLAALAGSVSRIVEGLSGSGGPVPANATEALAEISDVLGRHGFSTDPAFSDLSADDGVDLDEVIASLYSAGGDVR